MPNLKKNVIIYKKAGYMHINNVSPKTSGRSVFWFVILSIIMTIGFVYFYIQTNPGSYSFTGFCDWYMSLFKALKESSTDEPMLPWFSLVIIPLFIYGGAIATIVSRHCSVKEFENALNLKSVDFLQGRINFNFTQPKYNFACGYNDINELKLVLNSVMVHTRSGSYLTVSDIELKFTVLNNKKLSLTNVPINLMRTVYGIIDYGRAIHNFSYKFGGAGTVEDVREKIEDYMQTGCKQILATPAEQSFKWLSIVFFLLGIFFLYTFKDILSDSETALISMVAFPAFGFIAVSFIFDFFLLADKWNENRYKRF